MSLLDEFLEIAPAVPEASPAPKVALVPAPRAELEPVPGKRKKRVLGFKKIAEYIALKTRNFESVVDVVLAIVESNECEAKDRTKAAEFLRNWAQANPATVRHVVSGPGGKPIQHLHGHVIAGGLTKDDLAKLTDGEIAEIRAKLKAARERDKPPALAPAPDDDVVDVEVE